MNINKMIKLFALLCFISTASGCKNKSKNMEKETIVRIETSMGVIRAKLYNETPLHRDNFIKLTQAGVYDDILFHRVIRNFMVQTGESTNMAYIYNDDIKQIATVTLEGNPITYSVIRDGRWLDDSEYAVIHRIASSGRRRGVLHEALSYASGLCSHIRIDTHAMNAPMQRALAREGFVRTGIIVCDDGTDRVAFERVPTCVSDK